MGALNVGIAEEGIVTGRFFMLEKSARMLAVKREHSALGCAYCPEGNSATA